MAVGFAPGEQQSDGTYEVSTHDAHSWPELYFDGLGWVPFEPTPAYAGDPDNTDPAHQPSANPSSEPSGTPSATGSAEPTLAPPTPTAPPTQAPDASGGGGVGAGLLLGLGLLILALLAAPALVRLVQRRLRLRSGQADAARADGAWAEVRATIRDFGLPWADGSPGPVARSLAGGLPQQGAAALLAIARTVEISRYSREGAATDGLPALVRSLRTSVSRAAEPGRRVRAALLPTSLLPSARRRPRPDSGD
ncbi:hypothetical protein G7085_03020 [Tessaracoccus sp. HDW20]|nr:hypothetical protein [Tessaracoccus coleopterorum]